MHTWEAEPVGLHSLPINKGVCIVRVVLEEVRSSHVGICQASKQVFYCSSSNEDSGHEGAVHCAKLLTACIPEENGSSTGFSQGIASPPSSSRSLVHLKRLGDVSRETCERFLCQEYDI